MGGGSGTFDPEEVRDTIAAALVAGNNVSIGDGGFVYSVPFGFVTKPLGDETLLIHVFAEDVNFAGDFAGARGVVETNPTADYSMDILKNGIVVGGILVTTAGVISFSSSSSSPVSFVAGDVLKIVAQDPADLTINNAAFTLRGERT